MPSSAIAFPSRPTALHNSLARRLMLGIAATLVVAAAAHLSFPLPFTPVPFTIQPLAVLTVGLLLGPLDGALALLAYLAEGAAGLPVFSPTGLGGTLQLLGPTGGYLMAYPGVALLAGFAGRRLSQVIGPYKAAVLGGLLGTTLLFLSGAGWLQHVHSLSGHALWLAAVAPFLPGEAIKILIAAGIYRTLAPSVSR